MRLCLSQSMHVGRNPSKQHARRTGYSLVELMIVVGIIALFASLVIAGVHKIRSSADRTICLNRLRQLGVALTNHSLTHGAFPPGCSFLDGKDQFPHLGWEARLLPFIERVGLWTELQASFSKDPLFLNQPPHIGSHIVPDFLCGAENRVQYGINPKRRVVSAFTSFLGVEGTNQKRKDGILFLDSKVRPDEVLDGASMTIIVAERPPSADGVFGWWYAGWGQEKDGSVDMIMGAREIATHGAFIKCGPHFFSFQSGDLREQCHALHYWSLHPGVANFLFADGSTRSLSYSAHRLIPALCTRAGAEPVGLVE